MSDTIIAAFFTTDGLPENGLTPSVRIWDIDKNGQTLIIGGSAGTNDPGPPGGGSNTGPGAGNDGIMLEVSNDDGFYKYTFDVANGYDSSKTYLFRIDAGPLMADHERYQSGTITPSDSANQIASAVLNTPRLDHMQPGSVGEAINQSRADLSKITLDIVDLEELITLVLKYETNRTRVDSQLLTLTVYDDDGTTPLRTFSLRDEEGVPNIRNISERVPLADGTTDNKATVE